MGRADPVTLVVAYGDVDIALSDYSDLRREAEQRDRAGDYESAVIQRTADD